MKTLSIDGKITFGQKGNIKEYASHGWALDEPNPSHTWTQELEAGIKFKAPATNQPLILKFSGIPYLGEGRLESQRIWLHINGFYCGIFNVTDNFELKAAISAQWLEPRGNLLTITMPNAKSPKEMGISEDRRYLGIALTRLHLTNA